MGAARWHLAPEHHWLPPGPTRWRGRAVLIALAGGVPAHRVGSTTTVDDAAAPALDDSPACGTHRRP